MLPHLEVLKLRNSACIGEEWEPSENGFCQLKFFLLHSSDPNYWKATNNHFPLLEPLVLRHCCHLQEIPLEFADRFTLQSIEIDNCECSVVTSANKFKKSNRTWELVSLLIVPTEFKVVKTKIMLLNHLVELNLIIFCHFSSCLEFFFLLRS